MVENGYRHLSEHRPTQAFNLPDHGSPPPTTLQGEDPPGVTVTAPPESFARPITERERRRILLDAAKQVGPAIFFSLVIIVVSFMPVFLLEAQEGRMFRPLAWTKTLAVGSSSILAITLVPVLMVMLIRGRLRPERANPLSRITQAIYLPILKFCLRHRWLTIAANLIFLIVT